jgi:hypothetical protein
MKSAWDFLDIVGEIHCKKIEKYRSSGWMFHDYREYHQYSRWVDKRLQSITIFNREYPKYKCKKLKSLDIWEILNRIGERNERI